MKKRTKTYELMDYMSFFLWSYTFRPTNSKKGCFDIDVHSEPSVDVAPFVDVPLIPACVSVPLRRTVFEIKVINITD